MIQLSAFRLYRPGLCRQTRYPTASYARRTRISSRLPQKYCPLTSPACIKLNERMPLLWMFERIACMTPDNCTSCSTWRSAGQVPFAYKKIPRVRSGPRMMPDAHDRRRLGGQASRKVRSCSSRGRSARGAATSLTSTVAQDFGHNLSVLPSKFGLTFDNFSTIRWCRLIWRDGDFFPGIAFEN